MTITVAEARRVALVIGQDNYSSIGSLNNSVRDALRVAELLAKHGFEVIACEGNTPGCLNVNGALLQAGLVKLEQRAAGADMALVYFAGHGLATDETNILTPTDAKVNCTTGAITHGISVERFIAASNPAKMKMLILDACRANPLGEICPGLKGKKLSFTRIEVGAVQGLLLVTSTQFGQQALDGLKGAHSPFATALLAALEANPAIYFEQVFNEVARVTYEGARKQQGFLQIPVKVVGSAAPADCLAGKGCIGDARMAALAVENEKLTADAAGVRNLLAVEEQARGKPYTIEERAKRVSELDATLKSIGASTDPLRQEARRLIDGGYVVGGEAKLDEALEADEKALADTERMAAARRKAAAQSARDLAVLTRGTDVVKAVVYYQRAARLDPTDPHTRYEYARAALDTGRTAEAKTAFEQAAFNTRDSNSRMRYWSTLGLGDVAAAQDNLPSALTLYETALVIAQPIAKAAPGNAGWQHDLSVSHDRIGDVLVDQGNLPEALNAFNASFAIRDRLAKADPGNAGWQRDLAASQEKIGEVLVDQGNRAGALKAFNASLAIRDRLAKADPDNVGWQRNLAALQEKIGEMLVDLGNLPEASKAFNASLAIRDRLAKADPGNAGWQRDLSVSHDRIGGVLRAQGNLPGALEAFNASVAIRDRLAKADPGNVGWQRELSVSLEKVGDVLRAQATSPKP